MLEIALLDHPDEKVHKVKAQSLDHVQFITSHVESKFFWQSFFLEEKQGFVGGEPVLRASELWNQLLKSKDPSWQIVDSNTLLFFIEKWMTPFLLETGLPISSKDRQTALAFVGQLLPILAHEEGYGALRDWFDSKPEAHETWSHWYVLSQYLWQHLRQKKIVAEEFVSGLLIHEGLPPAKFPKLIFDLGLQLSATEAELIQSLGRNHQVMVLVPREALDDDLSSYHCFIADDVALQKKIAAEKKIRISPEPENESFLKVPSMLAEVKQCVAQVRIWLDKGIPPTEIAICSPIIENYWPTLYEYLRTEGVPVNKSVVAPLSQSMDIHRWMSSLKLSFEQGRSVDLRQYFFMGDDLKDVSFQVFQKQFKNFYGNEDLKRDPDFEKWAPEPMDGQALFRFRDFFAVALESWPGPSLNAIEAWVSDLDRVWACDDELSAAKWLEFLQRFFSRKEMSILPGDEGGIHVKSLHGVENDPVKYIVLMGLSQQGLKVSKRTPVTLADALSLKALYGFFIDHSERDQEAQQLAWIRKKGLVEVQCLFGETDFGGGFQAPSLFWLQGALASQSLSLNGPMLSRWDELMKAPIASRLPRGGEGESWGQCFIKKIDKEKSKENHVQVQIPNLSLSASMIEEDYKCPFRLLVQKGFGLRTVPSLDLDVDYQTRGVLLHKICEIIIAENQLSLDEDVVTQIIQRAKADEGVQLIEEEFWPYFEGFYRRIIKAFVAFEIQWRREQPDTKTVAVESSLKGFISPEFENLFSTDPGDQGIPFRGKIDRMDESSSGERVVIDYKTSAGGLFQYGSWFKKGMFQNIIYTLAVGQGLASQEAHKVSGAFYYILRDISRKIGIHGVENTDFLPPQKGKVLFEDFVQEGREILRGQLKRIQSGDFSTQPIEPALCEKCSWDTICRRSRGAQ